MYLYIYIYTERERLYYITFPSTFAGAFTNTFCEHFHEYTPLTNTLQRRSVKLATVVVCGHILISCISA